MTDRELTISTLLGVAVLSPHGVLAMANKLITSLHVQKQRLLEVSMQAVLLMTAEHMRRVQSVEGIVFCNRWWWTVYPVMFRCDTLNPRSLIWLNFINSPPQLLLSGSQLRQVCMTVIFIFSQAKKENNKIITEITSIIMLCRIFYVRAPTWWFGFLLLHSYSSAGFTKAQQGPPLQWAWLKTKTFIYAKPTLS